MRSDRTLVRAILTAALASIVGLSLAACSQAPAKDSEVAAQPAGEAAPIEPQAQEEVKVVQTSAQAKKYMTEEQVRQARRECLRKARRITGSRIPRNACQGSGSMYGVAPHIGGAEEGAAPGAIPGQ